MMSWTLLAVSKTTKTLIIVVDPMSKLSSSPPHPLMSVGGTWVYTPMTESDTLSLDPHRVLVHSSLSQSLRTNLSRDAMGFRVYTFLANESDERDPRRSLGHREVAMYLSDFAKEFGIVELLRFETEVVYASIVELEGGKCWGMK